jgi:hypothetical protein
MAETFEISELARTEMAKDLPRVKAAISTIANTHMGIDTELRPVYVSGGGVNVNGCEIVIGNNYVIDDWLKTTEPTREEIATVSAILEVAAILEQSKITGLDQYQPFHMGSPLRMLITTPPGNN